MPKYLIRNWGRNYKNEKILRVLQRIYRHRSRESRRAGTAGPGWVCSWEAGAPHGAETLAPNGREDEPCLLCQDLAGLDGAHPSWESGSPRWVPSSHETCSLIWFTYVYLCPHCPAEAFATKASGRSLVLLQRHVPWTRACGSTTGLAFLCLTFGKKQGVWGNTLTWL